MIREVVDEKRMPPWHADPKHTGKFSNDRSLAKEDTRHAAGWIDQGCPQGDDKDLPAPGEVCRGLVHRQARRRLHDAERNSPSRPRRARAACNTSISRDQTNFDEDRWVQAAECKPGNRSCGASHHRLRIVATGRSSRRRSCAADGIGNGMFVAYAPGDLGCSLRAGRRQEAPQGGSARVPDALHAQRHRAQRTARRSALIFAKEPPKYEVQTRGIANMLFLIPPGDRQLRGAVSETTFEQGRDAATACCRTCTCAARTFKYRRRLPRRQDGNAPVGAALRLQLAEHLPPGEAAAAAGRDDDRMHRPTSTTRRTTRTIPIRPTPVDWGEQTWEEMMIGFVDYCLCRARPMKILVIGKGGREHALVWKLAQSPRVERVFLRPGNAGTPRRRQRADRRQRLRRPAPLRQEGRHRPDRRRPRGSAGRRHRRCLPESRPAHLRPTKAAAQLEASKVFAKKLMRHADVPTAEFRVFDHPDRRAHYIETREYPVVVKADGLAAGKGVIVCNTNAGGAGRHRAHHGPRGVRPRRRPAGRHREAPRRRGAEHPGPGRRAGRSCRCRRRRTTRRPSTATPGPNTGGMGAYCPAPLATPEAAGRDRIRTSWCRWSTP